MKEYEIAVIDGGSAGLVAATAAHRSGARTALIERDQIGGECLHTGCIPSKTFLYTANLYHNAKNFEQYGLPSYHTGIPDMGKVMDHVRSVVDAIYQHENKETYQKLGIDVYLGENLSLIHISEPTRRTPISY